LDEEIGEKTSISFLINMNKLFEEFVGNLLEKRLYEYQVELQKTEHPEKSGEFKSKCDDFINEIREILDSLINKN
jgi:5-methylcytosine-specific restriction endonuclease McrBC regulatory subunit McrC